MNAKSPIPKAQLEIEKNLKRAYNEVIEQDVPDRFASLLEQLKHAEAANNQSGVGSNNAEK